jgi:drug/metabolite transporter (DMT)-like permease
MDKLKAGSHGAPPGLPIGRSPHPASLPYFVLGAAVLIVSSAAILIRFAQREGVPSLSIAALRLALAALILTPFALARSTSEIRTLGKRDLIAAISAGVFLAAHFAAWISSLAYTSVASSVALVTTNPVWIAIASWLLFSERPGIRLLLGIAFALGGSALIFLSDSRATTQTGSDPLLGNGLALAGSVAVCGYLLIGRGLRRHMTLLTYMWLVFSVAALALLLLALATGNPLSGFSPFAWLLLAGLAIGPQLLGHGAVNWALKYVSASFIAVAILAEPIGSALLAWLLLGEGFAVLQLCGFALLLAGIYLAALQERKAAVTTLPG